MISDENVFKNNKSFNCVLILVLMEYDIWQAKRLSVETPTNKVLILVLMEYDIWPQSGAFCQLKNGLNPCFNGIWYLTSSLFFHSILFSIVLILVLMEYDIWHKKECDMASTTKSLNPCFNGIWYLTYFPIELSNRMKESLNPCFNGIWYLTCQLMNAVTQSNSKS